MERSNIRPIQYPEMPNPHLTRAPIVEGLVQFHVKPGPKSSLRELTRFKDSLIERYPVSKQIHSMHAAFEMKSGEVATPKVTADLLGYRLERAEPSFVILARSNDLVVSKLAPYDRWESLVQEVRYVWEDYRKVMDPELVIRVATRFINRIELPVEKLDFETYLATPPQIPKNLPEVLSSFLVRVTLEDDETGASIATSQVLEEPNLQKNRVPVLIDIDVYRGVEFAPDTDEIWRLLDKMRDLKNRAFFGSLTPKALEGFM